MRLPPQLCKHAPAANAFELSDMTSLLQDVRYALRSLRRAPRFTAVVVLTLALGIGANTAIFSVVNRLLLHPLPYTDADRIVFLWEGKPQGTMMVVPNLGLIRAWKAQARSFDGVESYRSHSFMATVQGEAEVVRGTEITPGFPAFVGVHAALGRTFIPDDARPGAPPVVLISYARWQRQFGGSTSVLGRTITLDGKAYSVVGVMPPQWEVLGGPGTADPNHVWIPLSLQRSSDPMVPTWANTVARLRPGITPEQAQREMDAIAARVTGPAAPGNSSFAARVVAPRQLLQTGVSQDALLVLLAAVGLVLLVACANVANLLLARGTARSREIALRTALGAARWRLVRQILVESIMLALLGGAAGVLVAWWGLDVLTGLSPSNLRALAGVHLDGFVLQFALALSLVTGVLFGLLPALHATSPAVGTALRTGGSGVVRTGSGRRIRAVLVAAEMALSVVLLVSAGLLIRSVAHLQATDVGFDASHLFTVRMSLPGSRYGPIPSRELFAERMLAGIRRVPGVAAATQASDAPTTYSGVSGTLEIEGQTVSDADLHKMIDFNKVQPDYFRTIGIRLLGGRTFNAAEMRSGNAAIINDVMARHFWPNRPALGQRLRFGNDGPWKTVVGVVNGIVARDGLMGASGAMQIYMPYREQDAWQIPNLPPRVQFVVRSTSAPAAVIPAIRQLSHSIDPEAAVREITIAETQLAESISGPRFNMALLTAFAVLAVALAAIGLAAVIGYAVTERTHEIGIRMALGAREGNVLRLVVAQGMRAALIGVVVGVFGALAATRLLRGMLYGVESHDALTFAGVAALLLAVAFVASWLPARRAARVDPIIALRSE
jgi:putative ABC transport system permease protein